jgi:hypothetical protein
VLASIVRIDGEIGDLANFVGDDGLAGVGGLTMRRSLPVFTYEQTSSDRVDWSVPCQKQT